MSEITLVITAMDRLDLLEITLKSFLKYNTYPIKELIIRDDSNLESVYKQTKLLLDSLEINYRLLDMGNFGQIKSIDTLMSEVKSDLYFFLEEDWEFHRSGFIQDCLTILDEDTIQVRVRDIDDGSKATLGEEQVKDGVKYSEVLSHRFSFNPFLGQMKFYTPYSNRKIDICLEHTLDNHGFRVYSLINGACKHIGFTKPCNRGGLSYRVTKA